LHCVTSRWQLVLVLVPVLVPVNRYGVPVEKESPKAFGSLKLEILNNHCSDLWNEDQLIGLAEKESRRPRKFLLVQ
jgi:hypothetical protein